MKAVVLCAGYGTRLGQLTREIPKAMLDIGGHPLLAYVLGHLRAQGITDIAINLHFRPDLIRPWFGDGADFRLRLTYSHEDRLLGTAGGVKNFEGFLRGSEGFLVQYGDIVTDQDFQELIRFHQQKDALATLLVHRRSRSNSVVSLDATGRIVGFLERPTDAEREATDSPWVNSGVCVCSPEILDSIPAGESTDLPRDIFPRLVAGGRLFGFPLAGFRCAIDSPERLEETRRAMALGRCRIVPLTGPVREKPARNEILP